MRCFFLALIALLSLLSNKPVLAEKKFDVEFLEHLEGCHKGDNVDGILHLKNLLRMLGYLDYKNLKDRTHENDNVFDESVELAVKAYQANFHLRASGILDRMTLTTMAKPRCGVADVAGGKNWMDSSNKTHKNHFFHKVQRYSFFQGNYVWPASKTHLTFAFLPGIRSDFVAAISRAFATWQANTHFKFSQINDPAKSDIKISFQRGDHGDGSPFDGPSYRLVAHAFAPTDGRLHFDADNLWSVGAVPNAIDIQTTALHEIGHLLGLEHSNDLQAIMWPMTNIGSTKGLSRDDVIGIKVLYKV